MVCFETLGSKMPEEIVRNSFRVVPSRNEMRFPGLPKRNPGLEFANAFSVIHFG